MTPEETSPSATSKEKRASSVVAGAEGGGARRRPRRGLSLDRLLSAARPPLPHTVTLDAPPRPRRLDRPPLRRSLRLEDDAAAAAAADERRRVFGYGPHQISFDEGDVSDEEEHEPECECLRLSLERSGTSADTPEDSEEPELVPSPSAHPPHAAFAAPAPHLRGVSSDRLLSDRSPGNRVPARALSQGIFERRLPKIYKFGFMDKSKRASSSALYDRTDRDQSPTEAFYNATGSTRLSSQELFEKFCSEDFTSLYGRSGERRRRTPHSKSTGSSGSDVRHERTCSRHVPCGSQPVLSRRHVCRVQRSDRSTDSEEQPSPHRRTAHPHHSSLTPAHYSLRTFNVEGQEEEDEEDEEDCSRSEPMLSPDRFEARFTFDISEHSEAPSVHDETPSDATETRNLTLYEEPHSDRTSICEIYDAAFSSHRPSFRRDGSGRRIQRPFDLSTLDFRAIDDESPFTSRRASQCSADETLRQNSESRSWASDSVFTTPERRAQDTSPSSTDTRKFVTARSNSLRVDSAAAESTLPDTTVAEEEQSSVVERADYSIALVVERRREVGTEEEAASSPGSDMTRMSSRPSMHKLVPLEPVRLNGGGEEEGVDRTGGHVQSKERGPIARRGRRGVSEPRRQARCFPL